MTSLVTEVSCYAAMMGYMTRSAYSPLIWGSEAACWVQDTTLLFMVAVLRKYPVARTTAIAAVWLGLQALVMSPVMPLWVLAKFQVCEINLFAQHSFMLSTTSWCALLFTSCCLLHALQRCATLVTATMKLIVFSAGRSIAYATFYIAA